MASTNETASFLSSPHSVTMTSRSLIPDAESLRYRPAETKRRHGQRKGRAVTCSPSSDRLMCDGGKGLDVWGQSRVKGRVLGQRWVPGRLPQKGKQQHDTHGPSPGLQLCEVQQENEGAYQRYYCLGKGSVGLLIEIGCPRGGGGPPASSIHTDHNNNDHNNMVTQISHFASRLLDRTSGLKRFQTKSVWCAKRQRRGKGCSVCQMCCCATFSAMSLLVSNLHCF